MACHRRSVQVAETAGGPLIGLSLLLGSALHVEVRAGGAILVERLRS